MNFTHCCESLAGGGALFAFSIDLEYCDKEILKSIYFSDKNCYTTLPTLYRTHENSIVFKLTSANLEKYKIEYAYKHDFIDKQMRNFLHSKFHNFTKKTLDEDRILYNLSSTWEVIPRKFMKYPRVILIGLLNQCNVNCPHCPWFSPDKVPLQTTNYFKQTSQLSREKVSEILDFAALGNSKIIFSGPGEPLLDSNLLEYIKEAKDKGIKYIDIATNTILLTKDNFTNLIEAGATYFSMSLLFSKKAYPHLDGINPRKIAKEVCEMLQSAKVKGTLALCCYDEESIENALETLMEIKKYDLVDSRLSYSGSHSALLYGIFNTQRHTCGAPFASLYVFPDGSIGICEAQRAYLGTQEVQNFCFGNIYQNSLEEIWNSSLKERFLEKHKQLCFDDSNLKICKDCRYAWYNVVEI